MATKHPLTLALTSGKGGVGKSCIALNLAVALGREGQRVLLVDADWGLGNLAILAGASPAHTLEEVLQGACAVDEALVSLPGDAVLLPAASRAGAAWENATCEAGVAAALRAFEARFDFVLLDTGAGVAPKVVDFAAAAAEVLLIVTPEPTAIADAYATLKVLLLERADLRPGLLVNMAESAAEAADLYGRFQEIAMRFLGARIDNRGYIPLDRYVREAARRQIPFALLEPPSPAAEAIAALAALLLEQEPEAARQEGVFEHILQQRTASPGLS